MGNSLIPLLKTKQKLNFLSLSLWSSRLVLRLASIGSGRRSPSELLSVDQNPSFVLSTGPDPCSHCIGSTRRPFMTCSFRRFFLFVELLFCLFRALFLSIWFPTALGCLRVHHHNPDPNGVLRPSLSGPLCPFPTVISFIFHRIFI